MASFSIIKKHLRLALATIAAIGASSCSEGEHDYVYLVCNKASQTVNLSYRIQGDNTIYYDTLAPGQTDTLCWRRNVTGDDVWDVETSAQIYKLSAIEANIGGKVFTDSLRLKREWQAMEVNNEVGVYRLNIVDDHFVKTNYNYYFEFKNESGLPVFFQAAINGEKANMACADGGTLIFGPHSVLAKEIFDIYDPNASNSRIQALSLSNMFWIDGFGTEKQDTIYAQGFNPSRRSEWTFDKAMGDEAPIGVYRLVLTPKVFE